MSVTDWQALRAQAAPAASAEALLRWSLHLNGVLIGSVSPADAVLLAGCAGLSKVNTAFHLQGDAAQASAALAGMAQCLRKAGRVKHWRDELLPVMPMPLPNLLTPVWSAPLATVERGAARALGLLTHAVHLIGYAAHDKGKVWMQQRALSKSTDPGLWDTLAGGLVSAGDTLHSGVLRETYEEAGLQPQQLQGLAAHSGILVRRAVDGGAGLMVEWAWTYSATLVAGALPHNLDGEVSGFACLGRAQIEQHIAANKVTLEAALTLGVVWGELHCDCPPVTLTNPA